MPQINVKESKKEFLKKIIKFKSSYFKSLWFLAIDLAWKSLKISNHFFKTLGINLGCKLVKFIGWGKETAIFWAF